MKLHPRVTRSALELVKRFEGLRRTAARLPNGGWTVGYGHTRSAREGAVVSPEDADALLYYDLSEVAEKLEAWTFTPLNQNQFEALTAFAFNIGVENFRRSTVLKRVNEGQHLAAAAALELWRKSDFGGEDLVVDALVRRRAAEKAHYLTPPEGFRPSPTPVLQPTYDHSVIEAAANARAGRAAAVIDAPLEGDQAVARVETRPDVYTRPPAPFPFSAPATGVATARLHQLFPEKTEEPDVAPQAPELLSFMDEERDVAAASATHANDASFARPAAGEPDVESSSRTTVPEPQAEPEPVANGFIGFAPPPIRQFDRSSTAQAAAVAEVSPMAAPAAETPAAEQAPLFDTPSPRSAFDIPGVTRTARLRDDEPFHAEVSNGARLNDDDTNDLLQNHTPGPLRNRSMIYFSIGLLGVALFAAALFSMFSGKASPVNLVIGLMGILLMTPAGGFFLLRFLNKRDDIAAF